MYEYQIRHINYGKSESKVIEQMVEEGYRLVAVAPYETGKSLYFERPKQEEIKKVKIDLLWELIEDWQLARELDIDINETSLSYNDIEVSLYDKLEEIDPSIKRKTK